MPRLENNPVQIFLRVREMKVIPRRLGDQPPIGRAIGKARLEDGRARSPEVEGAAGVMLAVARGGEAGEDIGQGPAGGEFLADDRGLAVDTAKA